MFHLSVSGSPRLTDRNLRALLLSGSYVVVCRPGQRSTSVSKLFLGEGSHTGYRGRFRGAARGKITVIGICIISY